MVEKERKNVLEVRNHTDRVVSFLIRLFKRKKLLRFVPKAVRTQSISFIHSASRFPFKVSVVKGEALKASVLSRFKFEKKVCTKIQETLFKVSIQF